VSEAAISLYLDENLTPKIAAQLRRRGIRVVTAHELGALGDSDENHLTRAREMGCVLCTQDTDYLIMASQNVPHAGIVFGTLEDHSIGDWVNGLELICSVYTPDEMQNHIEYL
jgi:predicted nuclease of predicted toxin-antitoxin system